MMFLEGVVDVLGSVHGQPLEVCVLLSLSLSLSLSLVRTLSPARSLSVSLIPQP